MELDIGAFRTGFPEFADKVAYPDSLIEFWGELAEMQVKACVWKNARSKGVYLYLAHEITLATRNEKTAILGGTPGTFGGVANNKTVDGATVGYDSQSTSEKDAGYWNLTNYGRQFIRLARIFGAGAVQL